MTETAILNRVLIQATKLGRRLFRNNIGMAWMGKATVARQYCTVSLQPGDVVIRHAKPVKFGLGGEGGSDLIGFDPVVVTQEMVGTTLAVFNAVEVKTRTGRVSKEQQNFIDFVNASGGRGQVVRDPSEL